MAAYRPLVGAFWLAMLLPGNGAWRRNPRGTTEAQCRTSSRSSTWPVRAIRGRVRVLSPDEALHRRDRAAPGADDALMFRYADPDACPACRHAIDRAGPACSTCGVELVGPAARQVFAALKEVDRLVAELPVRVAEPAEPTPPVTVPIDVATSSLRTERRVRPEDPARPRCPVPARGLDRVLGRGVGDARGGRSTGVLVGPTVVATVMMAVVAHRGLRAGAEAFAVVALGLLAIDLGGAREAGWLGSIDDPWFLVVAGSVIALAGTSIASWSRGTQVRELVGAEVGAVLAVAAVAIGVGTIPGAEHGAEAALAATFVCLVAAVAARWIRLELLTLGTRLEVVLAWSALVVAAAERLVPLSVEHVWLDLAVWPMLAAR